MKKIFLALMAGVVLASCDLNFFPSDELNSDALLQDEAGAEYIMDGCYSLLKDEVEFLGYSSGNTFTRHFFQMSEFPADNCNLSSHTTDPLYEATALKMTDNLKNVGTLWMVGYKVIYMTNTIIETLVEGESADSDHLLGEAYFVRGWMHLNLATLYARPYSHGRDNLGIPLHISTNNAVVTRASVGDVYDQIVKDLTKASELMGASRGNTGYPSKTTALGILSRVYLYMGNYQECVNTVDAMLGGANAASKLDADLANLFINAKTSSEVLFCLAHETIGTIWANLLSVLCTCTAMKRLLVGVRSILLTLSSISTSVILWISATQRSSTHNILVWILIPFTSQILRLRTMILVASISLLMVLLMRMRTLFSPTMVLPTKLRNVLLTANTMSIT